MIVQSLSRIKTKENCWTNSPIAVMSIRSNTGIQIPNDSLERANKSTLVSIIEQLTTELSSVKSEVSEVKSEVSDIREDTDRLSRKVADTKGDVSDIREDTDRVSKKIADTNSRVSDRRKHEYRRFRRQ